jgi:hypothetical protein
LVERATAADKTPFLLPLPPSGISVGGDGVGVGWGIVSGFFRKMSKNKVGFNLK